MIPINAEINPTQMKYNIGRKKRQETPEQIAKQKKENPMFLFK
jgi:hypothetical protein